MDLSLIMMMMVMILCLTFNNASMLDQCIRVTFFKIAVIVRNNKLILNMLEWLLSLIMKRIKLIKDSAYIKDHHSNLLVPILSKRDTVAYEMVILK